MARGVHRDDFDIKRFSWDVNRERTPRDMDINVHRELNKYYKGKIGWPVRNGLFAVGVKNDGEELYDIGYGKSYLLFPIGHFKFVYDLKVIDLYASYKEYCRSHEYKSTDSFIESINYSEINLGVAMSKIEQHNRSVEIMINCENYYLISMNRINELAKMIWQ